MDTRDKRLYWILVVIAAGLWVNIISQFLPLGELRAAGTSDSPSVINVNIAEVGGYQLPLLNRDDLLEPFSEGIPVIIYFENDDPLVELSRILSYEDGSDPFVRYIEIMSEQEDADPSILVAREILEEAGLIEAD